MNHIAPYLFLSRENDNEITDVGKHDFRSVLLQFGVTDALSAPGQKRVDNRACREARKK